MKKILLTLSLLLFSVNNVYALNYWDSRTMALGGTGIAGGDYANASLNPALATVFKKDDHFLLSFSGGASFLDSDDVLENSFKLYKYIDKRDIISANKALSALSNADSPFSVNTGGSAIIAIPTKYIGIALVSDTTVIASVKGNIDPADSAVLEDLSDSTISTNTVLDSLNSNFDVEGVIVSELGLSLGIDLAGIKIGIKPKLQSILTDSNNFSLNNNSHLIDYDAVKHAFNMDVGLQSNLSDHLLFGLTFSNIFENTYKLSNSSSATVEIKPQVTAGLALKYSYVTAELNMELRDGWKILGEQKGQFLRAGLEIGGQDKIFALRAGYAYDMDGIESDVVSGGLGIKIAKTVSLDFNILYGISDYSLGGGCSFGLEF